MIEANQFSITYPSNILFEQHSFLIPEETRVCIIGPNGCGKSSILKAIAGLLPYKGKLLLKDREIHQWKRTDLSSEIAMLPQIKTAPYFPFSVYETISQGSYLKNQDTTLTKKKISSLLESFELDELASRPITELSGGQLQRVFLARTFLQDTSIFLLDEPTSYLDPKYQWSFIDFLLKLNQNDHKTILCVLHDLTLVLSFATHILLLGPENFIAFGSPKDILTKENLIKAYGVDILEHMKQSYKSWNEFF